MIFYLENKTPHHFSSQFSPVWRKHTKYNNLITTTTTKIIRNRSYSHFSIKDCQRMQPLGILCCHVTSSFILFNTWQKACSLQIKKKNKLRNRWPMEASKLFVVCLHQHLIWKLRPVIAVIHKILYRVLVTGTSLDLSQRTEKTPTNQWLVS